MITHHHNGVTYEIHPDPAECNRRITAIIRYLYPTYLQIRAAAVGATQSLSRANAKDGCPLPSTDPASGAERHRTSTTDGGAVL